MSPAQTAMCNFHSWSDVNLSSLVMRKKCHVVMTKIYFNSITPRFSIGSLILLSPSIYLSLFILHSVSQSFSSVFQYYILNSSITADSSASAFEYLHTCVTNLILRARNMIFLNSFLRCFFT